MFAAAIGYHRRPMRGFLTVSSLVVFLGLGLGLGVGGCGGCNDSNHVGHLPDARPSPDASPDAADMPVTLTIVKDGSPAIGVTVYFLNADDSVVSAAITDAMGSARAVMAAGGSVTAINPFTTPPPPAATAGDPDELRTFVGVKPGDRLVLSQTTPVAAPVMLIAPAAPSQNPSTTYSVYTTCGSGGISSGSGAPPSGTVALEDCNGTADLAVVASTPPPPAARAAQVNAIVEVLYQAGVTLPSSGNTLDLTADTYGEVTDVPFMYTNPPDRTMSALHWLIQDRGNLGPFPVDASGGTGTSHLPSGATATYSIVQTSLAPSGSAVGEQDVVDWGLAMPSYTLDLGGVLLPDLLSPPAFDAATGRVTWTEDAQGAAPDLTTTAIFVTRDRQWHWEIVAPYQRGEIRFPHVPADVFDWNPAAGDGVTAEQVMNAQAPGGYDAIRAHLLDLRDRVRRPSVGPPDLSGFVNGNSGRVVMVQSP
jgi:hypothetical protein